MFVELSTVVPKKMISKIVSYGFRFRHHGLEKSKMEKGGIQASLHPQRLFKYLQYSSSN